MLIDIIFIIDIMSFYQFKIPKTFKNFDWFAVVDISNGFGEKCLIFN